MLPQFTPPKREAPPSPADVCGFGALLGDRLVHQGAKQLGVTFVAGLVNHPDRNQIPLRVDQEARLIGAAPAVVTDRTGHRVSRRQPDREPESKAGGWA